jgi:hypothetical protein
MKIEFKTVEDLAKAAGHLAGHFKAAGAFHKAKADQHGSSVTEHTEMEAFHKGMHDGLEDGHADKAYHKRMAEHHAQRKAHHGELHKLHKAHAEHMDNLAAAYGEEKAAAGTVNKDASAAPPPAAPNAVVDSIVSDMAGQLKTLANDMITNDPATKQMLRAHLAEMLKAALGDKIVPDSVHAVTPSNAPDDVRLIPRGGVGASIEKAKVDPKHEDMFLM